TGMVRAGKGDIVPAGIFPEVEHDTPGLSGFQRNIPGFSAIGVIADPDRHLIFSPQVFYLEFQVAAERRAPRTSPLITAGNCDRSAAGSALVFPEEAVGPVKMQVVLSVFESLKRPLFGERTACRNGEIPVPAVFVRAVSSAGACRTVVTPGIYL